LPVYKSMAQTATQTSPEFLSGGGEMGALIRGHDWESTPLGNAANWPQSLRSVLSICLNSNFPIAIYWGRDLTLLYNDAWSPIPGNKHPWALGRPAREVWPDIWDAIESQFEKAIAGEPGGSKDALLPMQRHGYTEECYFDFTFTPVYGESGKVEGVFNAVIETTYRVISERRTTFLKNLALNIASAETAKDAFRQAIASVGLDNEDIPFAALYTYEGGSIMPAIAIFGNEPHEPSAALRQAFLEASQTGKPVVLNQIGSYVTNAPKGVWPEELSQGIVVPLLLNSETKAGMIVCGASARRRLDEEYFTFFENVGNTIATTLKNINALDTVRSKALALAEIDRAKTAFFSNISHEFRTPLTLMLGPVEDALNEEGLLPINRERLDVVRRNGLRLQKLVNALLDFSRIEAGRMETQLQTVDICALTIELASSFRSAVERAGIKLEVTCEPSSLATQVDLDMWEKIVLNLISNAFKYTATGTIKVTIAQADEWIRLNVRDTGIGISKDALPMIFERFHRVVNEGGRSVEGTGIGLALVKELVQLHEGRIEVESEVGKGSSFSVYIPAIAVKADDRPGDLTKVNQSKAASSFVEEAGKWVSSKANNDLVTSHDEHASSGPRVLIADDNADMRDYISKLLKGTYQIEAVGDGEQAFTAALRQKPDLIISDIMMPVLDGFGLVEKLRGLDSTRNIPVLFLSARAGEEARVEGLLAGADDYMVKPFSGKELTAKVTAAIKIANTRRAAEKEWHDLLLRAPVAIAIFRGPKLICDLANDTYLPLVDKKREELEGRPLFEVLAETREVLEPIAKNLFATGEPFQATEFEVVLRRNGHNETCFFNSVWEPLKDERGHVNGMLVVAHEVTGQVVARRKVEESEARYAATVKAARLGLWDNDLIGGKFLATGRLAEIYGLRSNEDITADDLYNAVYPDDREYVSGIFNKIRQGIITSSYEMEFRVQWFNGEVRWVHANGEAFFDEDGKAYRTIGTVADFTEQKLVELAIQQSEERFRTLAETLPQMIWVADKNGTPEYNSKQWEDYFGSEGTSGWNTMVHPGDKIKSEAAYRNSLAKGEPLRTEVRLQNKDGNYRWHASIAEPVKDNSGSVQKWIGALIDIHDQKTLAERLEQEVAERTKELVRSNEDLMQFAHVASHDLKEPVRKIKTFTKMLEMELGALSERGRLSLEKVQNAADRMETMITGVLAYSTLNASEQEAATIDLNETILSVESDLEILVQQKGATILRSELPKIEGAPVLIHQLFYNLINNSLKFSKAGAAPLIQIRSSVDERRGTVRISIEDDGIGFAPEYAQQIFKTFSRLNSKDKYEGTGLGLSLCKKIVERHGGTIEADGREGEWAKFTIALPLKQAGRD
jgi:PAS domain S-box-containing protein